jgi:ribosomal protein S18 acetylase RimI-like enzyme
MTLEDLPADAFDAYVERSITRFAESFPQEPQEEILGEARRLAKKLLPRGRATPGHHFKSIVMDGVPVGTLWWAEQLDEAPPRIYLFDIEVDEEHRGKGVGTAAMQALDEEGRRLGAKQVVLSVFFSNPGAIRLYERLGFEPSERGEAGMRMAKPL